MRGRSVELPRREDVPIGETTTDKTHVLKHRVEGYFAPVCDSDEGRFREVGWEGREGK